jgi:hypothetical protein
MRRWLFLELPYSVDLHVSREEALDYLRARSEVPSSATNLLLNRFEGVVGQADTHRIVLQRRARGRDNQAAPEFRGQFATQRAGEQIVGRFATPRVLQVLVLLMITLLTLGALAAAVAGTSRGKLGQAVFAGIGLAAMAAAVVSAMRSAAKEALSDIPVIQELLESAASGRAV